MLPNVSTPEPELNAAFDHIYQYWPVLTRRGESLAYPLPGRFVKPGGFFKWFFYWDSYFALLGLVVQGMWGLAREIVDGFVAEIEEYGFVPNYNGSHSVCSSRSQSPYLTSAIREVYPSIADLVWLERAASAAETEYQGYWLAEPHLTDTGLSRYIDIEINGGCETIPDTPHYRAIGESGWDNTPRFGEDATQVIPVDLNCQLYRYELDLADFADLLSKPDEGDIWRIRAEKRRDLINHYLWDESSGFYWDYDLRTGKRLGGTPRSLASYVPLWAGVADQDQAARLVEHLPAFEYEHGLVACEKGWSDETEHNYPTGWPYSHWYVCIGLREYGFHGVASRIAMKWLRLIANELARTGAIRERHNVVDPGVPLPGRYPPQRGFAWTNGVFAALLARIIFGIEPGGNNSGMKFDLNFPPLWAGKEARINLPNYPWPDGVNLKG
ncbi:MAG TPA: trehalase family glycosidase [Anaerolineales bacterium]|nr:trehalase family glycosidase [Anaerolineales bacterium]